MLCRTHSLLILVLTLVLLPLLLALSLVLCVINFICTLINLTKPGAAADSPPISGLASIVVLNYNGKELLAQGLPSIIKAVQTNGRPHEILVVDNGSTDGSVEFLRQRFPEVRGLRPRKQCRRKSCIS